MVISDPPSPSTFASTVAKAMVDKKAMADRRLRRTSRLSVKSSLLVRRSSKSEGGNPNLSPPDSIIPDKTVTRYLGN